MTTDALMIEALETLHSPSRRDGYWDRAVCNGCDADGWEAEAPAWPCQTAEILWPDPDEQSAMLAEWQEWSDPLAAAVRAKYSSGRRESFVPEIWSAQIAHSLEATNRFLRPEWLSE